MPQAATSPRFFLWGSGGAVSRCRWGRFVGSRRSPLCLLAAFLPPLTGPPRRHWHRCLCMGVAAAACVSLSDSPTSDAAGATTRAPLVKARLFSSHGSEREPTKGSKWALSGITSSWYSTSWIPASQSGWPQAIARRDYLQRLGAAK